MRCVSRSCLTDGRRSPIRSTPVRNWRSKSFANLRYFGHPAGTRGSTVPVRTASTVPYGSAGSRYRWRTTQMEDGVHRSLHYDVFTDTPLTGNQLAVFPEPDGLTTDDMARITREMNFSESTFIFPAERAGTDVRVRIFYPDGELPFAGHPTIGSTFALAQEGFLKPPRARVGLGLNLGPTPVDLEWRDGALAFAWMTQQPPAFGPILTARERMAAALGIDAGALK